MELTNRRATPSVPQVDEDQILVETFFRQLGRKIPLWLVPMLLEIVVNEASVKDFMISFRIAGCVDPNGG
ncbi:MAG TPA: hypothetical protein VNM67_04335 [Thermoanaerobaculia bacterium]|nr:hypothetical protein [Thermoanaerobaculia bacterium]